MTEEKLHIRKAGFDDITLLSVLAATTFYEAYFEQDNSHNLAAYIVESFKTVQIEEELADASATFFIAELNGKAVGYAKLREGTTAQGVENENAIELNRIYVLEKIKRRKIGMALINKCYQAATDKTYDTLWLGVWEQNIKAQNFYASLGFEKCGDLEFPYGDEVGINYVLKKYLD